MYTICLEVVGLPFSLLSGVVQECRTVTIEEDPCIDECDEDVTEPIVQAVSLSTAVISTNDEVRIYARDFIIFAQDDCTPSDDLRYTFNPNGPEFDDFYDASVNSSFRFMDCCNVINSPELITVYVLDSVGNAGVGSVFLTVLPPSGGNCDGCENDTIAPTIVTFNSLVWSYPVDSSQIEVWASDFIESANDNCTGPSNIRYSFTPTSPFDDPSASSMVFLCEDVENSPFMLPIYAWDKNGNFTIDSSEFDLQSSQPLDCDQFIEEITGTLLTVKNDPISGAWVYLLDREGIAVDSTTTDENGAYTFLSIPTQKSILIDYETEGSIQITFLDLIAVQRYMLGLLQFSYPEILASDIDGDGKVRVNDLRIMRKIILGIVEQDEYLSRQWNFITMVRALNPIQPNRFAIEQADMPDIIGYQIGDIR